MRLTLDEILEAQHQFWMGKDTKKHIKKQIREFEIFLQEIKDGKRRIEQTRSEDKLSTNTTNNTAMWVCADETNPNLGGNDGW